MSLTRRDIVGTVGQTVAAYALAIGIVGAGIGHFVALAGDLEDWQVETRLNRSPSGAFAWTSTN